MAHGYHHPTRSVPGGCVVLLFGGGFLALAAMAAWAAVLAWSQADDAGEATVDWRKLAGLALLLTAVGGGLGWWGWRLVKAMDASDYDPHDPDGPMMRF